MSEQQSARLNRTERLEKWWASLDVAERRHAQVCVQMNSPDGPFLEALRDAGIGLADIGWAAHSGTRTHIPVAIQRFVRAQED